MKDNFYILRSGKIERKENTIFFENAETRRVIPVEKINCLYCVGQVSINSALLNFLSQKNIVVHFFNYYGYYSGSFYPKEHLVSGSVLVKQVEHYLDSEKRLFIAKEIVSSTIFNLGRVLEHYRKHKKDVSEEMGKIEELEKKTADVLSLRELMQVEGEAWKQYYSTFSEILRGEFEFETRVRRPPDNEINCLISFMNALLYTACLTEIYHTQLNPTVSFLHEPHERRFSLALDISEMFKSLIVGRGIFKLVNMRMIKPHHFRRDLNSCLLNEEGKKVVLSEFDERLRTTLEHEKLERKVSQRRLLRLEGYKLVKHLIGDKPYRGFRIWW
jgi:CRISPR-associated protein Cas1